MERYRIPFSLQEEWKASGRARSPARVILSFTGTLGGVRIRPRKNWPDFEGVPIRVVRAAHLAVIALSVGRAKDFTRILALLKSGSVTRQELAGLAARHGLADAWKRFDRRFLDGDIQEMLNRQAVWQRSRQSLTWPEKLRMAEAVRESVKRLRASSVPERNREIPTRRES